MSMSGSVGELIGISWINWQLACSDEFVVYVFLFFGTIWGGWNQFE